MIGMSSILEAFGNAKTVMNNNSSRFGKFIKILYQEGCLIGLYLDNPYLLEKSRVVYQAINERNYHIFYFLQVGLTKEKEKEEYEKLYLNKCDNFWYTQHGNANPVPGISDKDNFDELIQSLELMGIDKEIQYNLWRLISGILNLGNVNFTQSDDGFAVVDEKTIEYVKIVANLWGITAEALEKRLLSVNIVGKRMIPRKFKIDEVFRNRDSIAKGLYTRIFLWIVSRINGELFHIDENKNEIENILFIGILDVFGFVNSYINSLEELS